MRAFEHPVPIGQEDALHPPEMDVDRLGHDPREVRTTPAVRQVVADDPPARPDSFEHARDGLADDSTERLGTLADLVRISRQERVDRDRVRHRATGGPGVQVTTPTSLGARSVIVQPSASWTVSSSSAARNRASFGPAGSIQS